MSWMYVLGEVAGRDLKIGSTTAEYTRDRRVQVDKDQMSDDRYVLLAAVRGSKTDESAVHDYFAAHRLTSKGTRREYYRPVEELIEYVLWLREQWFVSHDENEPGKEAAAEHSDRWLPTPGRRVPRPTPDPGKLFQDFEAQPGPLAGTYWSWMPNLHLTFQDYFTPESLVRRACEAMGGIDLDAASHYLANRRFHLAGIRIDDFFHVNKSAFTHDWRGRVWLNPPYGENEQWFRRAEQMLDEGRVEQLCMLSPAYAFITKVAAPMVRRASAAVLLSPTPEFHNPGNPLKTGTNLPHVIFYWGDRVQEFTRSFAGVGIPFEPRWSAA